MQCLVLVVVLATVINTKHCVGRVASIASILTTGNRNCCCCRTIGAWHISWRHKSITHTFNADKLFDINVAFNCYVEACGASNDPCVGVCCCFRQDIPHLLSEHAGDGRSTADLRVGTTTHL